MRIALLVLAAAVGCSDTGEAGVVDVSVYGESFIEHGIPASEFADGWSVTFSSFNVTLRDVHVGSARSSTERTFDLVRGRQPVLTFGDVDVARYDDFGFTIAAVTLDAIAKRAGAEKRLTWTFRQPVVYSRCQRDGVGVVVKDNASAPVEITVHADHLFLAGETHDESLRFDDIAAADANGDGTVTDAELAAAGLDAMMRARVAGLGHFGGEGECEASAP